MADDEAVEEGRVVFNLSADVELRPDPLGHVRSTVSTTETILPQPKPVKKKVSPQDKGIYFC